MDTVGKDAATEPCTRHRARFCSWLGVSSSGNNHRGRDDISCALLTPFSIEKSLYSKVNLKDGTRRVLESPEVSELWVN